MESLPLLSRVILYGVFSIMGLFVVLVFCWQIGILRGRELKNPDGSVDSWKQQDTHYGIAIADILIACPVNAIGIALALAGSRWGFYMVALVSFWWVWANVMTTATSLRFHKPRLTPMWFIVFPLGVVIGVTYIAWTIVYFDVIYAL